MIWFCCLCLEAKKDPENKLNEADTLVDGNALCRYHLPVYLDAKKQRAKQQAQQLELLSALFDKD